MLPQVFPADQTWRSSLLGRGDLWVVYMLPSMLFREVFGLHTAGFEHIERRQRMLFDPMQVLRR